MDFGDILIGASKKTLLEGLFLVVSQAVSDFTNTFHTLHAKMGIKYSEQHLVLKYHKDLHRYIQTKMNFLDISSLGAAY
jgi:hypothetical protein